MTNVVGMGCVSSIGLSPDAVLCAVRGGISRHRRIEELTSLQTGEPMNVSLLSTLPFEMTAEQRMFELAQQAARQALAALGRSAKSRPVPLLLALPPPRAGWSEKEKRSFETALWAALPVEIDRRLSKTFVDHEGGLLAIHEAATLLKEQKTDLCLVGGVDSPRDSRYLDALDREGRLQSEKAPDGMIPGEGAGFILLGHEGVTRTIATLGTVGIAEEPNPWHTGRGTRGDGLTASFHAALAGLAEGQRVDLVMADFNGQGWRADEWLFGYLRTAEHQPEPMKICHPADCWGELGAASSVLLVIQAIMEIVHHRPVGARVLVWAASDFGSSRAAVVVSRKQEKRVS